MFIYGFGDVATDDTVTVHIPRLKISNSSEDKKIYVGFQILEETEGDLEEWVTVYNHNLTFTVTAASSLTYTALTMTEANNECIFEFTSASADLAII